MKTIRIAAVSLAVTALFSALDAFAQQPTPVTVRGTIEVVEGGALAVKSREGPSVKVIFNDKTALVGLSKISVADVTPNSFVGVAALPQADGSQKALSVHVFPEALRGTNEGSRNYDLAQNSSMTNGAVAETVTENNGRVLTIKYRDGEKKITVDPSTSLVRFEPGAKPGELQTGVKVVINAVKLEDGTVEARRILLGRAGLAPAL